MKSKIKAELIQEMKLLIEEQKQAIREMKETNKELRAMLGKRANRVD